MEDKDDILFLNLDIAYEICNECKKNKLHYRRQWNKKQILDNISSGKIKIFMYSKNFNLKLNYKDYTCALTHYNKPCMKNCVLPSYLMQNAIENFKLWTYNN